MRILILGATGMLGHVAKIYFEELGNIVFATSRDVESEFYFDVVKNIKGIEKIIENTRPNIIINCIGVLNKDAEEHKSNAVLINSYLPHYLDELSILYNYKFIHISTDCVFDGKKGNYAEDSIKNATSFYGQSKSLGEINNDRNLTIRTSIVGPDLNPNGIGLFQWFMNQRTTVNGFSNVVWTGVTTIQLVKCIQQAINSDIKGLYHAVSKERINKFDLLMLFKEKFNKDINIVNDSSYKSDKSLVVGKTDFVFDIPSYRDMVEEMKIWILRHLEIYPNIILQIGNVQGEKNESNDNCRHKTRNN